MKNIKQTILFSLLAVVAVAATVQAEDAKKKSDEPAKPAAKAPAAKPAEKAPATAKPADKAPAAKPTEKAPATAKPVTKIRFNLPPQLPAIAGTVGKAEISGEEINKQTLKFKMFLEANMAKQMARVPEQYRPGYIAQMQRKLDEMPKSLLGNQIFKKLIEAYFKANNVTSTEADLKKAREELAAEAKKNNQTVEQFMKEANITEANIKQGASARRMFEDATSAEKIAVFIKDHPTYFNGTKVAASHILILCDATAATTEQKAAIDKLKGIAADIKAGKITFEEAAKKFSACPSKDKGGDLGEFSFDRMAPPFSIAAFDAKVDDIVGPVRTRFGFHLIKTTKRIDGKGKPSPMADEVAKRALMAELQNRIFGQALTTCPIVINTPKSKAAKAPVKKAVEKKAPAKK
ncbi:MAG: peptidylprolyl isomerase [Phycisphaerae bacterium]|nr:peptidylprolyl isomerase [Phycisphaerae bacterium]